MCYNPQKAHIIYDVQEIHPVLRFNTIFFFTVILFVGTLCVFAQADPPEKNEGKEPETRVTLTKEQAEGVQVAESAIIVYSGLRGREGLSQVRKTTVEIGKMRITNPDGTKNMSEYERRILRGESLGDEKIRLDQKFPSAEYALVFNSGKVFGIFNNSTFTPREDAANSFRNQIWRGLEGLLRYKENGSTVSLEKTDKIMGVEFFIVVVTDKENRSTKFYASKKSLRVMMLEYEENGVNYQRKFYDHNYAQGTLVPYRTVLWADGKEVEETTISTITFGQIVEESVFSDGSA